MFLDVNNDGRLDLATANGHIHDLRPNIPYAMPAQLLVGGPDGRLTDVTGRVGEPWTIPRIGRGLAAADLDNDGRLDLLLVAQNSPLAFFHNQTRRAGHFLSLRLEGTKSNRDAVGARVTVTAGGRRQTAWRIGGGSYASSSDPRIHFGLGSAQAIDDVEIRWPSGREQHFGKLAADRAHHVREGDPNPLKEQAAAPPPSPGGRGWRGEKLGGTGLGADPGPVALFVPPLRRGGSGGSDPIVLPRSTGRWPRNPPCPPPS